jgi:hypothetical protein
MSKAPFTFIFNIMVPGNPGFHLVISWAADTELTENAMPTSLNRQASTCTHTGFLSKYLHACQPAALHHGVDSTAVVAALAR